MLPETIFGHKTIQSLAAVVKSLTGEWVPLTTSLENAGWDGNDTKEVGVHSIDTSADFGAPAGIKAVWVRFRAKWTVASEGSFMYLRPKGFTLSSMAVLTAHNTWLREWSGPVPCDANGDIEVVVSGATAQSVFLKIYGYQMP